MPRPSRILWPVLAAAASVAADYGCRRLRVTLLIATTIAVVAFGVAGVGSARDGRAREARAAVLAGAAIFAAGDFAWLVASETARSGTAVVAALLDFGFAALSGILGVARQARRARKR
jgi:hypothetical protein